MPDSRPSTTEDDELEMDSEDLPSFSLSVSPHFELYESPGGRYLLHRGQIAGLADPFCGVSSAPGKYTRTSDSSSKWQYACRGGRLHGDLNEFHGGSDPVSILTYKDGVQTARTEFPESRQKRRTTFLKPELQDQSPLMIEEYRDGLLCSVIRTNADRQQSQRTTFDERGKKISEMSLTKGVPDGPARFWYPSGALRGEGMFVGPWMTGAWKMFYENGRLKAQGSFARGKSGAHFRKGIWQFYTSDGTLLSRSDFPGDQTQPIDVDLLWYNDVYGQEGFPSLSMEMRGKVPHGPVIYWHANGRLRVEGRYDNWKPVGIWTYGDSHGRVVQTEKESYK